MTIDDWGLAQAPATTTPSITTPVVVGAGLGVVAGGLVGALMDHAGLGAVAGGVMGAAAGYAYGTSTAPPAAPTTPAPGGGTKGTGPVLPAGPYNQVVVPKNIIQGTKNPQGPGLLPGETYLLSLPAGTQFQQGALTVVNSWGVAPTGWPTTDPNLANGIFMVVTNATTNPIAASVYATVWTTGGATS